MNKVFRALLGAAALQPSSVVCRGGGTWRLQHHYCYYYSGRPCYRLISYRWLSSYSRRDGYTAAGQRQCTSSRPTPASSRISIALLSTFNQCSNNSDIDRIKMATQPHEKISAQPFQGSRDRFGGVTVQSQLEARDCNTFESSLAVSLLAWRAEGVRGAWFHVHLDHAHWVPTLAKNGFEFHHGEGSLVMMVRWLPADQPCAIPRYAHTVVGVGALVVRQETSELLVVRERFHKRPHWKLPGGYVEQGEDLAVAAAREVLEETGVRAEFVSLVAARHTHAAAFTCSDLYFIVLMRPTTSDITMCTQELAACQWMKVEEYRQHPLVHETNRFFVECYLQSVDKGVSISATPLYSSVMKRHQLIYAIDFNSAATAAASSREGVSSADDSGGGTLARVEDTSRIPDTDSNQGSKKVKRDSSCSITNNKPHD